MQMQIEEKIKQQIELKVKTVLAWASKALSEANREHNTPQLDAELLLCSLLTWERHHLVTRDDHQLTEEAWANYRSLVERRALGEPIAYIIGTKPFMGMDFKVGPGVLIPRPDTELLVMSVLQAMPSFQSVCEVGTGSGAVIVSLLALNHEAMGCGLDISEMAIEITRENAYSNHVYNRLDLRLSDCFSALNGDELFDVIVSNPPYISGDDMAALMGDVADYEPHLALYGGVDGLDFYRKLAAEAPRFLKEKGGLFFEIGYDQAESVMAIMAENHFHNIVMSRDLAGHPRVVYGRKIG